MVRRVIFLAVFLIFSAGFDLPKSWAKIINVPGDQPTIQAGINAASNGDRVEVSPGTYFENINFKGKLITVTSTGGPSVTTIDGGKKDSVVKFSSGETPAALLSGFTITNGNASTAAPLSGGGVDIEGSSPTISGNVITGNEACSTGGGIAIDFSSAIVLHNRITNNSQGGCSGGSGGGGIAIGGAGSAQVLSNIISNNSWPGGGGISMDAAGTPLLRNNIISENTATGAQGGGVLTLNATHATLIQNLIVHNHADQGGGIFFLGSAPGPVVINNTIAANSVALGQGSAIYAVGADATTQLFNNLLIGTLAQNAVFCDNEFPSDHPMLTKNDAFSEGGTGLQGTCASLAGTGGNISAAPEFVDESDDNFRLLAGSPGIDVGLNSAPDLPPTDLDGLPRIVDGTGDGKFIVDMGAYEFQPVTAAPTSVDFGVQTLGSHVVRDVVLTNHQKSILSVTGVSASIPFSASSSCPAALAAGASCTISVTFAPTTIGPFNATLTVDDNDTNGPRQVALRGIGDSPGTPVIVSMPSTILAGAEFSITGIGFTAGSKVNFFVATAGGPVNAGPFTPTTQTDSELTVAVPDTVTLGQGFVSVEVVNTDTGFKASNVVSALLQGSPSAGIPTITSIDGTALAASSTNPSYAANNVETVVSQGAAVKLGGAGFDVTNGVAIDLFCACPGGKVGPFFLNPGDPGLTGSRLSFPLPAAGMPNSPPTGPGSFVVSNAGASKTYSKKSNAVSVPIGAQISVTSVSEGGARFGSRGPTITVNGTGFSPLTVINFFNTQSKGVVNLGGLNPDGTPKLLLTIVNDKQFTFVISAAVAVPGPSYVQALNPPFVPFSSSGNDPGGAFTLK